MSEKIQKEQRHLTIAELRKLKNYENVSDEQAQEIIFAVKNLAVIFYEHLNRKKKEKETEKIESENKKPEDEEIENAEMKTKVKNKKAAETHSAKIE